LLTLAAALTGAGLVVFPAATVPSTAWSRGRLAGHVKPPGSEFISPSSAGGRRHNT